MVVVFGSINLDLVARAPRIPAPGQTLLGRSFATAPGGKGANQALAARLAGADVAMYGAVGRDAFADLALVNLAASGVDLTGVARVDGPTGIALVNVADDGENAITVVAGANARARASQVPDTRLGPSHTLLMQLETGFEEVATLARRARRAGGRVLLNAAPARALPDTLLATVDVLLVNEHEAAVVAPGVPADALADDLARRFGTSVVRTLGARGAKAGEHRAVPPPVRVVDTTGAGDALAGALAAALDRGERLERALDAGVEAGALACTHEGAQARHR